MIFKILVKFIEINIFIDMKRNSLKISLLGIIIAFILIHGVIFLITTKSTDGEFVYTLDDAYIHMAISKNLVQNGQWSTLPGEFNSAASSIIYPLLLSGLFAIFGINTLLPLLVNMLFSVILILFVYYIAKRENLSNWNFVFTSLAIIIFTPLTLIISQGMENMIQIFVSLAFLYFSSLILSYDRSYRSRDLFAFYMLAPLVTFARYEGMFLVFAVFVLMMIRKKRLPAILMAVLAALPIVIFGIISISNGYEFFPNPVLYKSHMSEISGLSQILMKLKNIAVFYQHKGLLLLIMAVISGIIITSRKSTKFFNFEIVFGILVLAASAQHIMLARLSYKFARYEAYLVVMLFVALSLFLEHINFKKLYHSKVRFAFSILMFILILLPLGKRASYNRLAFYSKNIHNQHIMMAEFVGEYYDDATIVINDIGAISFYTNAEYIDLYALSNIEILRMIENGEFNSSNIQRLASERNAQIAILNEEHLADNIPKSW
ncbi:MAG: hypothetical protein ACLFSQ_11305, partial [Candidatus Zixiibacteriota bacterium]